MVSVGNFVRIKSLPEGDHGNPIEAIRQSAIGRVCRIREPWEGTSDDEIRVRDGAYLVSYAALSPDGVQYINFYTYESDFDLVEATEELLILYSYDLWQLVRPFGESQDTKTFRKLVDTFGYSWT